GRGRGLAGSGRPGAHAHLRGVDHVRHRIPSARGAPTGRAAAPRRAGAVAAPGAAFPGGPTGPLPSVRIAVREVELHGLRPEAEDRQPTGVSLTWPRSVPGWRS